MILLQATSEDSKSWAYELGYNIGYFFGSNPIFIYLIAGLLLAGLVFFFVRMSRKRRVQE